MFVRLSARFECRLPVRLFAPLLVLGLLLLALAAPPERAFASSPDTAWAAALSALDTAYDGYTALETVNKLEKMEIQSLRKDSASRLKIVHDAIRRIGRSDADRLQARIAALKSRHAPLLEQYRELGRQAAEARKSKNKKRVDLLDLKRNNLKPSVQAARLEIQTAQQELAAAKKQAAAKAKLLRDALAPAAACKQQVTAENKSIAAFNKTRTAAYKRYRSAVKQGSAMTAAAELTLMYDQLGRIHASQQRILGWEKQIAAAIRVAAAKLPL